MTSRPRRFSLDVIRNVEFYKFLSNKKSPPKIFILGTESNVRHVLPPYFTRILLSLASFSTAMTGLYCVSVTGEPVA